jgi:ribonuclease J
VSGHAYQEELKMMINLTRPYYLAPVHGEPRHQFRYQQIAKEMGYPDHRMFTMKDGVPLEFDETSASFGEAVPVGRVLVDSSGTPGVTEDVLKDRHNVAREGIVVITIPIDVTKGELASDPILQARGFHGPEGILDQAFDVVQDVLRSLTREEMKDLARVRKDAADVVRRLIQKRSNVRPLVLPTIVEV